MEKIIYLDNAATSWPKPRCVIDAMQKFLEEEGGNPGRSGHTLSFRALRRIDDTREALAALFGVRDYLRIIMTSGLTEALNIVILGYLREGEKAVTTVMDHNSVLRPFYALGERGFEVKIVECGSDGSLDLGEMERAIDGRTRLVALTNASNVTGTIMPVAEVAALAHAQGAALLVDAGQTAGCLPIDMERDGIDFLAFPGHKGLQGPPGIGGLIIGESVDLERLAPIKFGGSGGQSELTAQPENLPDRYEPGTLNGVGIAGLGAAAKFLLEAGVSSVREREKALFGKLIEGLLGIEGLRVYGPHDADACVAVVSFNLEGTPPQIVANMLDEEFGIMARPGLHCAPLAHKKIGTLPDGTCRFSIGYYTTEADVHAAVEAMRKIAREH